MISHQHVFTMIIYVLDQYFHPTITHVSFVFNHDEPKPSALNRSVKAFLSYKHFICPDSFNFLCRVHKLGTDSQSTILATS